MKSLNKILFTLICTLMLVSLNPSIAFGAEDVVSAADTTFIIMCSAFVLFMVPGVALFYAGMVRKKNVLSVLMQSLAVMGLIIVQWVLFGYSLAFGPDTAGLIGNLDWIGLNGVGLEAAGTIPHQLFVVFQMMFAVLTAALITGAFAERMRFTAFIVFILMWSTFVYAPLCHWVWGNGGWIQGLGALDFAGGTVVHISSGIAALVGALILGKRMGKGKNNMAIIPHNLPITILGAAILWFGWIGFNAGSSLAADGVAVTALLVTNVCAAAALISWVLAEWLDHGKPTALGAASGLVAGLVCITPAAGFVSPMSALIMGLIVGPICYFAVSKIKQRFAYDDALDVFGIHGIGGIVGALLTGVFASLAVNPNGADGLLYGNAELLGIQAIAVLASIVFVAVMTFIIMKVVGIFIELRVSAEDEERGLDISQHGEQAYNDEEPGVNGFQSQMPLFNAEIALDK